MLYTDRLPQPVGPPPRTDTTKPGSFLLRPVGTATVAYPGSDSFNYAPKVPPEPTCPCYYQQLPFCCCINWINTGAETADLAVPEASTAAAPTVTTATPPSASVPSPAPNLPLCSPYLFPEIVFPAADQPDPDPSEQWSPAFHAASPAASAADFSSSGGSPAGAQSLAGSPENYALSPASTAFAWPGGGYGELYSPSPVPSETT